MTNSFVNAAKKTANLTRTENDAVALRSTGSNLVDLFATIGALRVKSEDEVVDMFRSAFAEDKLMATKMLFYARNVRGGLGERDTFRRMLKALAISNPDIVIKNLKNIPVFGRWDDLYTLVGISKVESAMWGFIAETIGNDNASMLAGKPVTVCAKWLKSVNTSSAKSNKLGKLTAKNLGLDEGKYRKMLSRLRKYIDVIEVKMSSNEWNGIKYERVPSYAMKNYRSAFGKHDYERFTEYIQSLARGETKINAATLFPYDILLAGNISYNGGYGGYGGRGSTGFIIDNDPILEAQWKALPNYVEGENNILVMSDTSGSMWGYGDGRRPIATALGLAVYFAERNKGAFKNLFMTFSESPSFVTLKGESLKSKLACVPSIVANTNLEAAFDLILETALKNKVSESEMPKALIIISDMQFDGAVNGRNDETFHKSMKRKFKEAGYEFPSIIYWQVCARSEAFQAKRNKEGVMLVSGNSASTFKSVLNNIGKSPWDTMVEVLSDPIYDCVII